MNVLDRFLTYVSFHTTSSEDSATVPSTERQLRLAEHLVSELNAIGLERVTLDRYGRVYAFLPGSVEGAEPLGFIAHMDTVLNGKNMMLQVPYLPIRAMDMYMMGYLKVK